MAMPTVQHFARAVKKFVPSELIRFYCSVKLPKLRRNKTFHYSNNLNYELCKRLRAIAIYDRHTNKNYFRAITYQRAVTVLQSIDWRITSGKQAMELPGIGTKVSHLIDLLLSKQTLPIEDIIKENERTKIIKHLAYVPGIGVDNAIRLVAGTIRRFGDLKSLEPGLPLLKYANDFRQKIPRKEVKEIYNIIKNTAVEIDQNYMVSICGSYRRGTTKSSKINVLLTYRNHIDSYSNSRKLVTSLNIFLLKLMSNNLLVDFSTCDRRKLMAVCRLSHDHTTPYRKLKICIDPYNEYCCNLFYSTGSTRFIRKVADQALKKNYALDRYWLRPFLSNGKLGPPEIINCEEDIFRILELPYTKPLYRNL